MIWYQFVALLFAAVMTTFTGLDSLRWLIKRDVDIGVGPMLLWPLSIVLCVASFTGVTL